MEDEHLLVQDLLKRHNLSVSALAQAADMADSTLYEYTGGRRKNIPLRVWRALFELTEDVRILEFTDEQLEAVNTQYPVWRRALLKAGTYPGQALDIRTISQPNLLVIHQDVPADVVYHLVKNLYVNLDELHRVHQATASMALENAILGLTLPLHPGALRFFEEQGINIPPSLR